MVVSESGRKSSDGSELPRHFLARDGAAASSLDDTLKMTCTYVLILFMCMWVCQSSISGTQVVKEGI